MSNKDCGCNKPKEVSKFRVKQIYSNESLVGCTKKEKVKVFPMTISHAVIDACTGESVYDLLKSVNHRYLTHMGEFGLTVLDIPESDRHKGMVITYSDENRVSHTLTYNSDSISNADWTDKRNWVDTSNATESAPIDLSRERERITALEDKANAIEQFKSDMKSKLDALSEKYNEVLNLLRSNNNNSVSPTEVAAIKSTIESLLRRLSVLEAKPDKDTIYDPTSLVSRIEALEGRPVNPTVDLKPITDRLSALESKPDKDTVFNPKELLDKISSLESELNRIKAKPDNDDYIISGEWIDDDTISITLNSNKKVVIRRNRPEPPKPDKKIKWGYIDLNGKADRVPTIQDLTGERKQDSLPIEFMVPTNGAVRGKYIFAIDKSILPSSYKVEMKAFGGYQPITENEMTKSEETIDSVTYVVFKDTSINRDWDGPEFRITQL